MRLVMPPSVSIPLAIIFFALFRLVLGPAWCLPAFAGMLVGYLIYDMTHYHVHHHRAKNKLSLALRRYHYRHHFQQSDRGYGVSSPFWDRVFRTSPVIRRTASQRPLGARFLLQHLLGALEVVGAVDVEQQPVRIAEPVASSPSPISKRVERADRFVQRALGRQRLLELVEQRGVVAREQRMQAIVELRNRQRRVELREMLDQRRPSRTACRRRRRSAAGPAIAAAP